MEASSAQGIDVDGYVRLNNDTINIKQVAVPQIFWGGEESTFNVFLLTLAELTLAQSEKDVFSGIALTLMYEAAVRASLHTNIQCVSMKSGAIFKNANDITSLNLMLIKEYVKCSDITEWHHTSTCQQQKEVALHKTRSRRIERGFQEWLSRLAVRFICWWPRNTLFSSSFQAH